MGCVVVDHTRGTAFVLLARTVAMERPDTNSRREFLSRTASVVGLAGAGGLAGCLGQGAGDGEGAAADTAEGDGTSQTPTPARTSTPEGLQLETLAVGGSSGGSVVVEPAGEAALLDFFATWCAPCKPQMEELRTVRAENPDLHMLSVSREKETETIESFWTEYEGTWPVAQDTQLLAFQEYNVRRIPTLLVLDASGSEVWRHSGLAAADDILEQITEARA